MSDYRNFDYRDPNDPLRRDTVTDPNARPVNAATGWIAAAVFVVVVLAVAFGLGHRPSAEGTNTASNDVTPPAATRMAPPVAPAPPANTAAPSTTPAPISPTPSATPPNAPAAPSVAH